MYVRQVFRIPLSLRNSWRNQDPLDENRRIFNYRVIDGKSTSVWFGIVSALFHYIYDFARLCQKRTTPSDGISAIIYITIIIL